MTYSGGSYTVGEGDAVVGDDSDGARIAHWDGGEASGTASGSNDYVYIQAQDPTESGDQKIDTLCGVSQGSIPDGATLLAVMDGSAIQQRGKVASPFGGTLGWLNGVWDRNDYVGSPVINKKFYEENAPIPQNGTLGSDRLVMLIYQCDFSAENPSKRTEWCVQWTVDGNPIDHAVAHFVSSQQWEYHNFVWVTHIPAGNHQVGVVTWLHEGPAPHFHYSKGAHETQGYIGRRWDAIDLGPSTGRTWIGN